MSDIQKGEIVKEDTPKPYCIKINYMDILRVTFQSMVHSRLNDFYSEEDITVIDNHPLFPFLREEQKEKLESIVKHHVESVEFEEIPFNVALNVEERRRKYPALYFEYD